MSKYIISDPNIMGGEPVIKGTRTPVEVILYRLKRRVFNRGTPQSLSVDRPKTFAGAIDEIIQLVNTTFHAKGVL